MDPQLYSQLLSLGTLVASAASAWGVSRYQTALSAAAIEKLETSKALQSAEIARLTTEVAVLKSMAAGADRRMTESLADIRETISRSEARVIAHFDAAVQALRGDK